jgi:ABC-type sugar transport system permease subunit
MAIWLGFNFMTFQNINAPEFVGLDNYKEVLTDSRFWQAVRFTLLYIVIAVPALILSGFILAMLLDQTAFFREVLEQRFFFTEVSVKILIMVNAVLGGTPFPFITLYAGLLTLPQDQVEAAVVDGANRWQQIRYIVFPHLRSLLVFLGLIMTMDSFRVFDSIFVLSQMNPVFKADSVMVYIFRTAMTVTRLGKGNAMAIITVIMILIILVPFLVRTYREQMEER